MGAPNIDAMEAERYITNGINRESDDSDSSHSKIEFFMAPA